MQDGASEKSWSQTTPSPLDVLMQPPKKAKFHQSDDDKTVLVQENRVVAVDKL